MKWIRPGERPRTPRQISLAAATLAGDRLLALAGSLELGDQCRLFELGYTAKDLTHQDPRQPALANLDLSSRRRRPRSTSAPVAWQVLRLGQPRELRRHFGGESEFKLDQTTAHEGAEVIAPHEFLVWRIEVFERLTAQAPP